MNIRLGYELIYQCSQPTPMILCLNIHYTRSGDLISADNMLTDPWVPLVLYRDGFGNWCTRLVAPAGRIRITAGAVINDRGLPDPFVPEAQQHSVDSLPEEALVYLLGSRYCDSENLSAVAWNTFGNTLGGWSRVQAVCDFVHRHITFGYQFARATRTASEAFYEQRGVCRDYTHLAIALCRSLNIPARYCTGYISDIGLPSTQEPQDFAAWFEAYIGGTWYTFDARNNAPRFGRVLIARGRDAADVAISMTFGQNVLEGFRVWVDEVKSDSFRMDDGVRVAFCRYI